MKKQPFLAGVLFCMLCVCSHGVDEAALISVLKSDASLHQKARACQQLAVVSGKGAVPVLAGLLGDKDLGDYARFGLQPIDDPSVDDALRDVLGKLEGRFLVGVVNSIGVRRDTKAVGALRNLVRDPGKGAAPEALMALGMIATDEAIETIRGVLTDGPPALRMPAADAALVAGERLLDRKRKADAVGLYDVIRDASVPKHLRTAGAYGAMVARGEAGIPLILAALKSEDTDRVGVAMRAAQELPGSTVSDRLVDELEKMSPAVQARLIGVFVERGNPSARKAIEGLAGSDDAVVRMAALKALGDVGAASSVGVLLKALGGEGAAAAGSSLRTLKGEGVDAAVLAGLGGVDGSARVALIEILADRHSVDAVPALFAETAHEDPKRAGAAFKALGALAGPEHLPPLIKSLLAAKSTAVSGMAESAVVNVAGDRTDEVIVALDTANSSAARVSLLRVLGRIGGAGTCAAVVKASADPNPEVKDAAVRALASWPNPSAADALMGIVKETQNKTHRVLALRGYIRLSELDTAVGPDVVARRLAEAMTQAKTADTRKAVLGALAKVPNPDALELAMSQRNNKSLRTEAELATLTIARAIMGTERERVQAVAKTLVASADKRTAKEARGILEQLGRFAGAISEWRISGPYMQKGKRYDALFDIVFEPEKPDAKNVKWRPVAAGTHPKYPQILDLLKALDGDQRVAYALTWVYSAKTRPVSLQMGSDDGIKAWLNGKLVHAKNTARAANPYTDKVSVVLEKGWNPLLLKITQNQGPWAFCARFSGRPGKRLEGLRFDPHHEGEWRLPKGAPKPEKTSAFRPAKAIPPPPAMKGTPIFDGKTFAGWEGNLKWFRIEDGAIVGGTLKEKIPHNEFLCTKKEYVNFQLKLKLKLVDNKGNAGIQVRSRRIPNHHEMIGYQADVSAAFWGALYDESRRNKMLAKPDRATLEKAVKVNDWNEYIIRCEGKRIQLWLNGIQTVDYMELDPKIPQIGIIGLQIHGGPPSEIRYKDIEIMELPTQGKPNLLFIAVDDLRPQLGCYGKAWMKTPNIDRLAASGVRFNRHYVQVATCGASRHALLTGLRPTTDIEYGNAAFGKQQTELAARPTESFAHLFKQNGYYTAAIGKISHNGSDCSRDLPRSWSEVPSADKKFPSGWDFPDPLPESKKKKNLLRLPCASRDGDDNVYKDGHLADLAVTALGKLKDKGNPFALAVGFIKPHLPFSSPKKYWDMYDPEKIPAIPSPDIPEGIDPGMSLHPSFELVRQYWVPEGALDQEDYRRKLRHAYCAAVSYMDAQVGKVLDELDRLDLSKNTIVVLWGDHGWHLGDLGTWGKHTAFERALRSPLLIKTPGMKTSGQTSDALIETVDIYPTLAELCGLTPPEGLGGKSFTALLSNPKAAGPTEAFGYHRPWAWKTRTLGPNPWCKTMRTDRYRLSVWTKEMTRGEIVQIELYDHQTDPEESNNLVKTHPEIVKSLITNLDRDGIAWDGK